MAKYYISSGTLQIIRSTSKMAVMAACDAVWKLNDNDTLDEFMYVDERGYRDYKTADKKTMVYKTTSVLTQAGWSMDE